MSLQSVSGGIDPRGQRACGSHVTRADPLSQQAWTHRSSPQPVQVPGRKRWGACRKWGCLVPAVGKDWDPASSESRVLGSCTSTDVDLVARLGALSVVAEIAPNQKKKKKEGKKTGCWAVEELAGLGRLSLVPGEARGGSVAPWGAWGPDSLRVPVPAWLGVVLGEGQAGQAAGKMI